MCLWKQRVKSHVRQEVHLLQEEIHPADEQPGSDSAGIKKPVSRKMPRVSAVTVGQAWCSLMARGCFCAPSWLGILLIPCTVVSRLFWLLCFQVCFKTLQIRAYEIHSRFQSMAGKNTAEFSPSERLIKKEMKMYGCHSVHWFLKWLQTRLVLL